MTEERTYQFDESINKDAEATRTSFIENLKKVQLGHIYDSIKEELLTNNHDILEANDFLADFSNFRIARPSDEKIFTIIDTTGEKAPIYIEDNDELRPVYDIIMNYDSMNEIMAALAPYHNLLKRHELLDILAVGKYDFEEIPRSYTVGIISPDDGKKVAKTVEYKNAELFDVVNQYYKRATSDVVATAYKNIEKFAESSDLTEIYDYIKESFDNALSSKSLSSEQLAKADELFAQIPYSVERTVENEFCFEELKQAYQKYQLEPKLGNVWIKLPDQVQKSPEELKHGIPDGKVKDSGSRKIKSMVKNVDKMEPEDTITKEDGNNVYKMLIDNGSLLPLKQIYEYTNKMSQEEKDEFLDRVDGMNSIYNKNSINDTADDIILKPKLNKFHILKYLGDNIKFHMSDYRQKDSERRFKLYYKNPFGEKPVAVSQLFEEEKENDTPVPLNLLMKISSEAAKELKVTQDAAEKLAKKNLEELEIEKVKMNPAKKLLQKVKKKFEKSKVDENEQSKVHPEPEPEQSKIQPEPEPEQSKIQPEPEKIRVIDETSINISIQDLEEKSKEEIIAMIQNGSILSSFSLEDIEKVAEQRREEQQHEQYLQRQKEGLDNFKKKHIIENAKLNYADDPEKLNDYLAKNNISQLEWELQKPLSETEEQVIVQEREKQQQEYEYNRQDFIDYASSLSGIDRYTLLHGVPGEENNQYGVTNADVEKYIQSRENATSVVELDLENGKSK